MLAFEISINGSKKYTTGIEANGCMSAILTWLQHQPARNPRDNPHDNQLTFDVGAAWTDGEVRADGKWLEEILKVGDSITIRIVEVVEADGLATQKRATPRDRERSERRYYEQLQRKYRRINRRRKKSAR